MTHNTKTSTQKFGDGIRNFTGKIKSARKNVADWNVPDTIRLKQVLKNTTDENGKVVTEINWNDFATWVKEIAQSGLKGGGVATLWLAEYLTRFANVIFVDNGLIRRLEKASKKDAISELIKKYPWIKSYLMYYMMLFTMLVSGGQLAVNALGKDEDKNEEKKEVVVDDNDDKQELLIENTINIQTINPNDDDFVERALNEYWAEIGVGLTELETYRATPVVHAGESRATRGLGCTWDYEYNSKGVLIKKPNVPGKTKSLDKDKNYEQTKLHLIDETLPVLKNATKGKNNIQAQQAIALIFAGYQRPNDMKEIANRIAIAKTPQEVADAFDYYPGPEQWRTGTLKRRWWCAAYAIGKISSQDLLALPRDAFSNININNVYKNGHFLLGDETVAYALNHAKQGNKSGVETFLSDFADGKSIVKQVKANQAKSTIVVTRPQQSQQDTLIESSMAKLNLADKFFEQENFLQAAHAYTDAINIDQDNMEAYSSLALAYKKLGDKHNSINYYEKCLQTVKSGNARMNANKDLLLDRNIKAATYYNAGLAREEMAKIYYAQEKYNLARDNYNMAARNYKTALDNAYEVDLAEERKTIYQNAIQRVQNAAKNVLKKTNDKKKTALNSGIQKLKQQNARQDLLLYGKEFKGNMA